MKILIFAPSFKAMHPNNLINLLIENGNDVYFLTEPENTILPTPKLTIIRRNNFKWRRFIKPYTLSSYFVHVPKRISFQKLIKKIKPDVIHVIGIGDDAYYCALSNAKPLILTSLGGDINQFFTEDDYMNIKSTHRSDFLHKWVFDGGRSKPNNRKEWARFSLRNATLITSDTYELLDRSMEVAEKEIETRLFIFNSPDPFFIKKDPLTLLNFKEKYSIPIDSKVILSIRRIQKNMGHLDIIKAFSQLSNEINQKVVLIIRDIFSSDGETLESIKNLIKELSLERRIIWLPYLDYEEMPTLYQISDLVINYPIVDGFPSSLIEAGASKVNTITSRISGYSGIIDNSDFITLEPAQPILLAQEMKKILEQKSADELRLQNNFLWALELGEKSNVYKNIHDIYQTAINMDYHKK